MDRQVYNSYLEVDLGELSSNIQKIRKGIGEGVDIIAVLKGNAYGLGLVPIARHLDSSCGIRAFACAQTGEAVRLREEAGISGDILVMGGVPFHNIHAVVRYDIQSPAYDKEYLARLDREARLQGKTARVHIKIETGLNRIGVLPGEQTGDLCEFLKSAGNISVSGVYTHFTESEIKDKSRTYAQLELFKTALEQIRSHGFSPEYIHASNTAASTWLRDPVLTHIRPAGLLFGFDVNDEPKNRFSLNEVLSWRAFITNVKTIQAGDTVGYNRRFVADRLTRIATVSAGYGDGYTRSLAMSGAAEVLIRGKRAKIIGICMDQTHLDVTGIDTAINDEVTLIGRDGDESISVFELQEKMGQTYLATIAVLSQRVARFYKK